MTITKYLLVVIHHHLSFPKCIIWYIFPSKLYGKCHFCEMQYYLCLSLCCYRTGPLIGTWCMRMEGKNSYFKRAAQTSNFKNVPYSVAKRHQRLLCSYLLSGNVLIRNCRLVQVWMILCNNSLTLPLSPICSSQCHKTTAYRIFQCY